MLKELLQIAEAQKKKKKEQTDNELIASIVHELVLGDDEESTDASFARDVARVAKKHGLNPEQTELLRDAADGPIGY